MIRSFAALAAAALMLAGCAGLNLDRPADRVVDAENPVERTVRFAHAGSALCGVAADVAPMHVGLAARIAPKCDFAAGRVDILAAAAADPSRFETTMAASVPALISPLRELAVVGGVRLVGDLGSMNPLQLLTVAEKVVFGYGAGRAEAAAANLRIAQLREGSLAPEVAIAQALDAWRVNNARLTPGR